MPHLSTRFLILRTFSWLVLGLSLALGSCTTALPEFQHAASLAPGTSEVAVGGFSGRGLNASTGGIAVVRRGITDQIDLTSSVHVSRLNIEQPNVRLGALVGPKWSNKAGTWAFSMPVGSVYSETFNDIDAGFTSLCTPTLYRSWVYPKSESTATFFMRSEFAYNFIRGSAFTVIGGYNQSFEGKKIIHYVSASGSTNGPFYGVYFGYGIGLKNWK